MKYEGIAIGSQLILLTKLFEVHHTADVMATKSLH